VGAYLNLLFIVAGNFGIFFFVTQFMQGVLRFSPLQTGLAYLPMAATLLATVRLAPRLLTRWNVKALILPGTFMQAAAILWLSRLSPASQYASSLLGPMVLVGLAAGLCIMPLNMTALSGVERKESGAASGFAQTMMSLGGSFGLAILVTIYGAISRGSAGSPTEVFVRGTSTAFLVAACFATTAFLVTLFVIQAPRSQARKQTVAISETNKSVVRRYFEMWNTGDAAHAHEILHPHWVDHAHPEIKGIHEVTAALQKTLSDSPDFHIGIETMISEGDRVAVHSTVRQTREGNVHTSRVMWLVRVEGDKMAEMWTAHEPLRDAS
jgi:predicted SnoaL-like aldol condensation-catalyzing enzyme